MIIWIRNRKGWIGVVFFVLIGIFRPCSMNGRNFASCPWPRAVTSA